MPDAELLRYSRQILLPQVGIEGQERLAAAHAVIMGVGGLGCPVATYLASAGVGHLTLVDFDRVESSNLQRQVLYSDSDIGRMKVEAAASAILARSSACRVDRIPSRLGEADLRALFATADVVVDGTDSFTSRRAINAAAVAVATPLVSGAVIRFEGQLTTFDFSSADAPCYHCLYGDGEDDDGGCTVNGVIASLPGVVGSLQATEVLKLLLGLPTLSGRLLIIDGLHMEFRELRLRRDPDCSVCGSRPAERAKTALQKRSQPVSPSRTAPPTAPPDAPASGDR